MAEQETMKPYAGIQIEWMLRREFVIGCIRLASFPSCRRAYLMEPPEDIPRHHCRSRATKQSRLNGDLLFDIVSRQHPFLLTASRPTQLTANFVVVDLVAICI